MHDMYLKQGQNVKLCQDANKGFKTILFKMLEMS